MIKDCKNCYIEVRKFNWWKFIGFALLEVFLIVSFFGMVTLLNMSPEFIPKTLIQYFAAGLAVLLIFFFFLSPLFLLGFIVNNTIDKTEDFFYSTQKIKVQREKC